jgi:MFS family permease
LADDQRLDAPSVTPLSSAPSAGKAPGSGSGGGFGAALTVMRIPAYRDFTIGSAVSVIGVWLQRVATGWLTWELTETPSWLGIILFTDLFVMTLCAPLAGVVADRMDRLKMLRIAQLLGFLQALSMTVIYALGWMTIGRLVALTVFMGICHATYSAARLSLLPNLEPPSLIPQAIAINAVNFSVARFLGPAVAGAVIAGWGLTYAFGINAAAYVLFTVLILRLRVVTPDRPRREKRGVFSDMVEGCRYAASHAGIGPMLAMMLITAFTIRALPDLLPAFAAQAFGRGVGGLAWLTSAMGLGAMLGGLQMTRQHGTRGLTHRVIWNVALMAVAIAALAATQIFWFGVASAVVCGYVLTINGTGTQALIQSAVDGALRGRVMAVFTLIYQGAPALGAVVLGALADHFGMRWPFFGGAALCLVVWFWMSRRAAPLRAALETGPAGGHATAMAGEAPEGTTAGVSSAGSS